MSGGEEWIRTNEGISQQIYSLPRLATSVPPPRLGWRASSSSPEKLSAVASLRSAMTVSLRSPLRPRAKAGAGDGNRTHLTSLEGWRITTMLRPRNAPPSYNSPAYSVNPEGFRGQAASRHGASTASGMP